MFGMLDHVIGAATVRIRRMILQILNKPDISVVNNNLCIGGVTKISNLAQNGISAILDLRSEDSDNIDDLLEYNITYLQIKIKDRTIPTYEDTTQMIKWLNANIASDKKIFVHCNLGRGRAPLMACLYLISCGMSPDKVIKLVKKCRRYMFLNARQLNFLYSFNRYSKELN